MAMRLIPSRLWALAVLSGILQVLPFPIAGPVPMLRTEICWIALLPLLAALVSENRQGNPLTLTQGAVLGYVCGIIWYLGNCYWIYQTMYLYGGLAKPIAAGILALFCLYLGLYHALFGTLLVTLRRKFGRQAALLLVPFVWITVELARARITGFPWDFLGITQIDNSFLTRLAPVTGTYGLSFVIAAVNALWLVRVRARDHKFIRPALTLSVAIIAIVFIAAVNRSRNLPSSPTTATATLVQENLGVGAESMGAQETKQQLLESFAHLSLYPSDQYFLGIPELSSTPAVVLLRRHSPINGVDADTPLPSPTDLIVWPESPAPFADYDPEFRAAISTLARTADAPIIVDNLGVTPNPSAPGGYDRFNSASFIAPNGDFVGRYDKMHLVPFGEYVPFKSIFSFAGDLLAEAGDLSHGTRRTVFRDGGHAYGTFICYESVFPNEVRQFVLEGADVLVNISDDGWYGDTSAPWQHLNMVRMRAIENHRWVLRATNTGVTAAINPYGRVTEAAPRHIRTSIQVHFGYENNLTFYTRYGDVFAYLCALITSLLFAASLWPKIQ
ncbi:apolipoprotein N-acyltransferase [Edaphobacter acidisoli]|uniref:Apolipoprotein N-acyltransferase n=1 Tax=Edaphobacter acidisoli TaxID=2040573 RepID=A0A916W2J8_9BACT|nr:apolipoprotein N-acyltransferase [Edaphobacter acidisoli]GGA61086.1 apolipoprotein N-acyltransferase [Edaphobacter acidisoli]